MATSLKCDKVSMLVNELFDTVPGEPLSNIELIDPLEVPWPYHRLLVHQSDMTSTLANYYGEPLKLRVLRRVVGAKWLARRSVLELSESGRPVEFGVIRVNLESVDERLRPLVIEGTGPLGGLLNEHLVTYRSCPGGYLRTESTDAINALFGLDRSRTLYGRCNCLSDATGRTIAEVVEILPP